MKKIIIQATIILCGLHSYMYAQTIKTDNQRESFSGDKIAEAGVPARSIVEGTVKDGKTGERLVGATVFVLENEKFVTITDYDGNYSLSVPAGIYTLVCSYISYEEQHIPRVQFEKGKQKAINFQLNTSSFSINQVTITARANVENELVTLSQQKKATVMETSMGANELSRKGASDVAAGVKKMSGISMIGSSQLFVRGLGDRYNQVQLNGMFIPSPDPTKKVINLNLFPTDVVKTIGVSKVFCPANNADYSGALINIETKDYPDKKFITIGGGIGFNNQTSFRTFSQSNSSTNNFWGTDVSARKNILPEELKTVNRNQNSLGLGKDMFRSNMGYTSSNALPAIALNISGGDSYKIGRSKLGVLFASSFDNDYLFEDHIYDAILKADGTVRSRFYKDTYTYSTRFTNLVNLSHISSKGSTLKANLFYTSGTEDMLELKYNGWSAEGDSLYVINSEYTANHVYYAQILGKKTIHPKFDIEWKTGYSVANSSNPDRKQITYFKNNDTWTVYTLNQQESFRVFIDQQEQIATADVVAKYRFDQYKTTLSIGSQALQRNKTYNSYVYYYNLSGVNSIPTNPENPLHIFSEENFENNAIYLKNGNSYPMSYTGSSTIFSTYTDAVYTGLEKTLINVGIRYEFCDMQIHGNNQAGIRKTTPLTSHDILPAVNIRHSISDNANIRFAASKTITRPSFYEKSPAAIIPKFGEPKTEGNKDLQNAYNINIDTKYEVFPDKGVMYSIGAYAKSLKNPIEMVARPTGGETSYTFTNTQQGYAGGMEFEFKKLIQEKYFVGCNTSYIYTFIEVAENANETEKKRRMQGASPYLINADLGYQFTHGENKQHTSSIAVVYNVYGKRLYAVGTNGMGSVFEMPFNTLDLLYKSKLSENWNMNVSVKNLLNQTSRFVQGVNYNSQTNTYERFEKLKEYEKGISAGISVSYTIN